MASTNSAAAVAGAHETEFDAAKGAYFEKTKASRYMSDKDLSELPLFQRINWLSTTIIFTPLIASLIGIWYVPLQRSTFILAVVQYMLSGMGITMGYHRLWSHKAYHATFPVEFVLLAWGAAAFEGSARWWCRNHRAHHRYVDSDQDPYAVHKGFWYAHLGWMVLKQDSRRAGRVDISDLNAHKGIMFQHRHYLPIALFFGFVLPVAISTIGWGDFWGGLVWAGFCRMFFVHQAVSFLSKATHRATCEVNVMFERDVSCMQVTVANNSSLIGIVTDLSTGFHDIICLCPLVFSTSLWTRPRHFALTGRLCPTSSSAL
jgi:fatty-acid desaturase